MKKILLIVGAVIIVGVFVYFGMNMNTDQAAEVQVEKIKTRELVEKVSASGRVQPRTQVDITSEINGEIMDLKVREGDTIRAGQLLIVLDTVQLQTGLDEARYAVAEINARLEGNKTLLDQDKEEFERQKSLLEKNLTSETVYKNANYKYLTSKSSYEASLAQAQQYQSRYEKQLDNLSKAKISSPMKGIVTLVDCEIGEIAAAQTSFTQGKTLMKVADLNVFEVEVEVDETEIAKIRFDQPTEIEIDALPDTVLQGKVVEIGNTALVSGAGTQDQSTDFKVKVVLDDRHPDIRPGMSATVDIVTNRKPDVLTVPFSAVVIRSFDLDSLRRVQSGDTLEVTKADDSEVHAAVADETDNDSDDKDKKREELKGVFVIRDGAVKFIEVKTGIADQKNIEIISELKPGDSVVSGPYRQLRSLNDGDKVTLEIDKKKEK